MAPMLVPVTQCTGTRNSSSTFSTPTCARPRAPPPDSTRPIRWASASPQAPSISAAATALRQCLWKLGRNGGLLARHDLRLDHAPERIAAQPLERSGTDHQRAAFALWRERAEIEVAAAGEAVDGIVHREGQ